MRDFSSIALCFVHVEPRRQEQASRETGDLCIHHGNAIIKSPKGVLPDRVSSAPSNRDQIVPSVDMVHRGVALSAGRSAP